MIRAWVQLRHYGARHGVDPLVFAGLYFARLPLLLAALAVLTRRARRHRPVASVAVLFLALGVFPYGYVLVAGRDLPVGFIAAVATVAGLAALQGARRLRAVLRLRPTLTAADTASLAEDACSGR